jgi:hypothetical protein
VKILQEIFRKVIKYLKVGGFGKKSEGRNRKNIINVYLREGFRGK